MSVESKEEMEKIADIEGNKALARNKEVKK